MRKLLLIFCILGMGEMALAQWTTSGSNIYNSNAGNVGIGTSGPSSWLDLYGGSGDRFSEGIRIRRGSVSTQYGLISQIGGALQFTSVLEGGDGNGYMVFNRHNAGSGTAKESMRIDGDGNVSIGRADLTNARVTIASKNVTSFGASASSALQIDANDNNKAVGNLSQIGLGLINDYTPVAIAGIITNASAYSTMDLAFATRAATTDTAPIERMRITSDGNVSIGTTDPQGYKLAVNGNMIAESVKVKLHANWPDYVFHRNYLLKPLPEVEQYIKTNEHLPDIPSAKEVKEEGLNLGEMNAKLLQKIEELTLYLIEKDKQLTDLQERMKVVEGKKQKNKKSVSL